MQQKILNDFYRFDPVYRTQTSLNLFWILRPFCRYRLYLLLKPKGEKKYKYKAGHLCTYKQMLYGRVKHIELSAERQYTELLDQFEKEFQKSSISGVLYQRTITPDYVNQMCELLAESHDPKVLEKLVELDRETDFNVECRRYLNGEMINCADPILTEDDDIRLWFHFKKNRLLLTTANPNAEDFSTLLKEQLHPLPNE